jgi:hypothetical protein
VAWFSISYLLKKFLELTDLLRLPSRPPYSGPCIGSTVKESTL